MPTRCSCRAASPEIAHAGLLQHPPVIIRERSSQAIRTLKERLATLLHRLVGERRQEHADSSERAPELVRLQEGHIKKVSRALRVASYLSCLSGGHQHDQRSDVGLQVFVGSCTSESRIVDRDDDLW